MAVVVLLRFGMGREASVDHWLCPGKHLMNKEKSTVVGSSNALNADDRVGSSIAVDTVLLHRCMP